MADDGGAPEGNSAESGNENDGGEIAERPDHVPEKFWNVDTGTTNTEAWSASTKELEGKLRSKTATLEKDVRATVESERLANRPETSAGYNMEVPDGFEMPEGMEWEFSETDPMIEYMRESVHAQGGDQAMFDDHMTAYMNARLATLPDYDTEAAALGDYGEERMQRVEGFLNANLSEEAVDHVFQMTTSAEGIKVFEELMEKMGEPPFTPQDFSGEGDIAAGMDELREMQADERYWHPTKREASFVKQVDDGYKKLLGTGMTNVGTQ